MLRWSRSSAASNRCPGLACALASQSSVMMFVTSFLVIRVQQTGLSTSIRRITTDTSGFQNTASTTPRAPEGVGTG